MLYFCKEESLKIDQSEQLMSRWLIEGDKKFILKTESSWQTNLKSLSVTKSVSLDVKHCQWKHHTGVKTSSHWSYCTKFKGMETAQAVLHSMTIGALLSEVREEDFSFTRLVGLVGGLLLGGLLMLQHTF